jgi:hypothetical protein
MDSLIENLVKNKVYIIAFAGAYFLLHRANGGKRMICSKVDEGDPNILKLVATHNLQRIAAISYGGARVYITHSNMISVLFCMLK